MWHNLGIFSAALLFIYFSRLGGSFFSRHPVYSILAGYGVFGLAGLFLGLSGLFQPLYLWVFAAVLLILSRKQIASDIGFIKNFSLRPLFQDNLFLKVLLGLWLLTNFLIVFVPITGHDTLSYHLPIIRDLIQTGRLTFTSEIQQYDFLPVLGEIFYAVPLALFGNTSDPYIFQLLQYSVLILFLILIHNFLKDKIQNKFLIWAALLMILSIMDFQREILHGGYVDVLAYLFGIASTLLIIQQGPFYLSALFLGFSLSVKYLALFFGAMNGLFMLFSRVKLKTVLYYGLIVLVIAGFWYGKNLIIYGNPIYPMFSKPEFSEAVGWFLTDRTFANFLVFPFVRYGQWFVQAVETSSRLIALLYFAALYLLVLFFIFLRKQFTRPEVLLFLFIEIYLLFLFFTSHQYRFLLPAVIMLPPLLALLGDKLLGVINRPIFTKLSKLALALAVFLVFLGNFHYFHVKYFYLLGQYTREEYILEIGGQ